MDTATLLDRITDLEVQLDNVLHMTAAQRVACALKKLPHKHTLNPSAYELPYTKGTLALQIGIEAETFARSIHRLPDYGIHVAGRQVEINDNEKARRLVCQFCAGRHTCRAY